MAMRNMMTMIPLSFLVLTLLFSVVMSAKNEAPAPAVDCSSIVLEMADCLSYVTEGGTATKPEGTCCSGLKTVLKTDAECLCEAFRNSAQLGVTLNMTKAMALPSACHVSAPSVTNCGLSIGTGAAPGLSPTLAPTSSSVAGAPTTSISSANDVSPTLAPGSGSVGSSTSSAISISVELFVCTTLAVIVLAFF